ncbi:ABC transporter ATP-binding protein [Piscinibacter koreensis]|uniref:ABC transporter ATP-binding protein n=1 Tax=Piscinibacter koreensis TaxID=2742824 RepID=A0A7Y6NKF3_9BURK|nr:ABC transporter ATP-binding protein [Schlegelella koreensis]NUZ04747.1 ABC transporter ATP-binding protein [Schlegelella koreensis]
MSAVPLLDVQGVHAHYGQSHVLHGASLSIKPGEGVGLLGRNGMGKTTLIRTVLGLMRATGGSVRMHGREITRDAPDRIARLGVGYVPEGRGIFPTLTVRENLVMAARPGVRGQRDWTLDRVLQLFPRLAERIGNCGAQLSGGEQQMLAIGRALMTNPDLVILDEATEGLAPLVVAEIWRTIGLIRSSGIASLVVDRNFRAVLAHTDKAVVLEKGKVVMQGSSAELAGNEDALHRVLGV